jgi:hypothetical protein
MRISLSPYVIVDGKENRMKSLSLAFVVVLFSAGAAFATCPTPPSGRQGSYPYYLYNYTQGQTCYSTSGNVSSGASLCGTSDPGWQFGSGTSTASASYTLGQSDPILDPNDWEIDAWIDLTSPGGTSADRVEVDVDVTHPNNTVSYYTLYFWSGASGNLSSCNGGHYKIFSANTGDTITITVAATNSGNATIKVSVPELFNKNF